MINRDGHCESLWQKTTDAYTSNRAADPNTLYDVILIGGGITGITTATELQREGFNCLVIEAANLCFGTTGGTTAHINTLLDTPFAKMEINFGKGSAGIVAEAAKEAVMLIQRNIHTYTIECEYEDCDAYLFSKNQDQSEELEVIRSSAQDAGLDINYTDNIPVRIAFEKAIKVRGQAKFHPVKYVHGLAKAFEQIGGTIIQHCRATGITESEFAEVETVNGKFKAKKVIYATHIPPGVNLIHLRCQPYRTYAMAVQLTDESYPVDLVYDMEDPYHYYRTQIIDGERYFIAGGFDHKTGKEADTEKCLTGLETHVRKTFEVANVISRWSSQYFEPADGLPYIGHLPGHTDLLYVASGFGGNGMTYSHIAASVLKAMLTGKEHPAAKLFNPGRIKPVAGFKNFISQSAETVKNIISKLAGAEKLIELADLAPGEARVVNYEHTKLAIYKNENGKLFAVNSSCTHLHCTVAWNTAEQSWDCPCHGARFGADGQVLTCPADKNLEPIDLVELVDRD